ncbi:MAG TPA: histidine kinase [Xanthobacteraceae bacterium]|nr:histidine kinase [Xanthobacteraceae bacterium]
MPSLLRFLAVIGVIAGIGFGIIFALAYMVDPPPRDITVTVPADRFYKQR